MGISDKENIPGYLVTMDLEKAFNSLDHDFLLCVLKNFGDHRISNSVLKTVVLLLSISHLKEVLAKVIQYQDIFLLLP